MRRKFISEQDASRCICLNPACIPHSHTYTESFCGYHTVISGRSTRYTHMIHINNDVRCDNKWNMHSRIAIAVSFSFWCAWVSVQGRTLATGRLAAFPPPFTWSTAANGRQPTCLILVPTKVLRCNKDTGTSGTFIEWQRTRVIHPSYGTDKHAVLIADGTMGSRKLYLFLGLRSRYLYQRTEVWKSFMVLISVLHACVW